MVREARQPCTVTPQRPRVSNSSATTVSRGTPWLSLTNMTGSQTVSVPKKRVALGERLDNVFVPSLQPSPSKARSSEIKRIKAPLARPSLPASRELVSTIEESYPAPKRSRLGTPSSPRRFSLPLDIDEDDTLLLDLSPPKMTLGALEKDGSEDEMLVATRPGERFMTPANSQEKLVGSLPFDSYASLISRSSQSLRNAWPYRPLLRANIPCLDSPPHLRRNPCPTLSRTYHVLHTLKGDLILHSLHLELDLLPSQTS